MAPVTTDALVLHAFPYGETSRIARLLTPGYGVQSVVAKGAMRPRSGMGSLLQVFSEGSARFYFKRHRDLHTLADFDVQRQRPELAGHIRRFAAASAVAELVIRFAPTEPHPEIYDFVTAAMDELGTCGFEAVETRALGALWGVISALGFAPSLDVCARDGTPIAAGAAVFSVHDGGLLCAKCSSGVRRKPMPEDDRQALLRFICGDAPAHTLDDQRLAAHRRLLERFVERHVAEGRELRALAMWSDST